MNKKLFGKIIISLLTVGAIGLVLFTHSTRVSATPTTEKNVFDKRYIMYHGDLSIKTGTTAAPVYPELDRLEAIMTSGAAVGYNGVVLDDYKSASMGYESGSTALSNFKLNVIDKIGDLAKTLDMKVIPYGFASAHALYKMDVTKNISATDLVEALPVVGGALTVKTSSAAQPNLINNGDFEQCKTDNKGYLMPVGFTTGNTVDGPGTVTCVQDTKHSGSSSVKIDVSKASSTIKNSDPLIALVPQNAYELSYYWKTEGLTDPTAFSHLINGTNDNGKTPVVVLLQGQTSDTGNNCTVTSDQPDWTKCTVSFSSKDKKQMRLYLGLSSATTGTIWLDDVSLHVVNTVAKAPEDTSVNPVNNSFDTWTTGTTVQPAITGFEEIPAGWPKVADGWTMDSPAYIASPDEPREVPVPATDAHSLKITDVPNCNLLPAKCAYRVQTKPITVVPKQAYKVSFWLKTDEYQTPISGAGETPPTPVPSIAAAVSGYDDNATITTINDSTAVKTDLYSMPGGGVFPVASTQVWTQYSFDFNSLDRTQIKLWIGDWSPVSGIGSFSLDDVTIEKVPLISPVERSGMEAVVKGATNGVTYTKGSDYLVFENLLSIPDDSKIKIGDKLLINVYNQQDVGSGAQASGCRADYYTYIKNVAERFKYLYPDAPEYMINYDEWRVANWDPVCRKYFYPDDQSTAPLTAGQYFSNVMKKTITTIRSVPLLSDQKLTVWGDMFDPNQNATDATKPYYVVNGVIGDITNPSSSSWTGWKDDQNKVTIFNWNIRTDPTLEYINKLIIDDKITEEQSKKIKTGAEITADSLMFWSGQGREQILGGYYDEKPSGSTALPSDTSLKTVLSNLEANQPIDRNSYGDAALTKVDGYMYTTWHADPAGKNAYGYIPVGNYADLEAVAQFWKDAGRWPSTTVKLAADKKFAYSGEIITYTVSYQNTSGGDLKNVNLSVPIPTGTQLVPDSITNLGVADNNNIISWHKLASPPGELFTAQFQVKVN